VAFLDFFDRLPGKLHPAFQDLSSYNRELLHFAGSLALIAIAEFLRGYLHPLSPAFIGLALVSWMTYQEFHLHPKKYGQSLVKGIIDWLVWCAPFAAYLTYLALWE